MPRAFLALVLIVAFAQAAPAQTTPATQPEAAALKLTTDRLVIFKDGHGLVMKSGSGTADPDGRAFITEVPEAAVLGCFWATGGDDSKVLAMRAEWIETKETRSKEVACVSMVELIRANVGKQVTLELVDKLEKGQPVEITCKLVDLLDVPPTDEQLWTRPASERWRAFIPSPEMFTCYIRDGVAQMGQFTPESFVGEGTLTRDLTPRGGDFLVIEENADARRVIHVSRIASLRGAPDMITTTTRQQEIFTRTKRLSFDFGKDSAGKNVSLKLFYFTPGLRWIPTYRVSGDLKSKADLALQGEVINDVTDIEHAALDLVAGVPNFRFGDSVSPLTLEQAMRQIPTFNMGNNAQMLNSQFDNRARLGVAVQPPDPAMVVAPELLGAGGEQDLFVYNIADFSLKKGARATVPLWQQQADLRHVYTYDVNIRRSRSGGNLLDDSATPGEQQQDPNPARRRGPNRFVFNQVWHQLELTNGGKVPWTTGAALMMRNLLPLGQDLLVYTPPTGKSLLPVTVAVDLRGSVDEQETGRTERAKHFDGNDYMLITKKGTITVTSFRSEKSDMRIALSTGGKVTNASDGGKIKPNDFRAGDWEEQGYHRVNEHTDVSWEFVIEPGTTKTLTYEVSFYTR